MSIELNTIAVNNLELLRDLGDIIEDYNIVVDGKVISHSNENYEGLFSLKELEYPIYFSFHQIFNSIRYSNLYKIEGYKTKELIELFNEGIDKIVDILDQTENDPHNQTISQLIDDIDNKYLVLRERAHSCSFWKISETFNDYLDTFSEALKECNKYLYITTRYDNLFEEDEDDGEDDGKDDGEDDGENKGEESNGDDGASDADEREGSNDETG